MPEEINLEKALLLSPKAEWADELISNSKAPFHEKK